MISNKREIQDKNEPIIRKVSVYESTNFADFKNYVTISDEYSLKKLISKNEDYSTKDKSGMDNMYRQVPYQTETLLLKKNIDINYSNKDSLKYGKTIKDFNLFWIAISALTNIYKEEKFIIKDKEEINEIFNDFLDFYSNYIFKNKFNLLKLSLMIKEVIKAF